ncbi:MAG: HEAT repeat domain-containing protein [Myxococcota bacterium]
MTGAIWLLLAAPAWAGPLRDSVMTLLGAYEAPIDAASVAALGDGAGTELVTIADDATVPPTRRARALTALQHVPQTPEVAEAFRRHLAGSEPLLQRHAALSMAVLGDDAIGDLTGVLSRDDVALRVAAVQALGRIDTKAAKAALIAHGPRETEGRVQKALHDAGVHP